MARHVLSDSEAKSLFATLSSDAAENGEMGRSLEHCLGIINSSLGPAFGLEVRTVSLDRRCAGGPAAAGGGNGNDQNEPSESSEKGGSGGGGGGTSSSKMIRYHALINKITDEAAKSTFMTATALSNPLHGPSVRSPHEMAYLRLIIERIVERGMELDENAGGNSGGGGGVGAGCRGTLGRIDVLNLRNDLEGPHEKSIGAAGQAEHVVSSLVAEGWLVPTAPADDDYGDDDDEDGDDEETGEDGGSKKRRRGGSRKRKGGRTSLDGLGGDGPALSHLMIGPQDVHGAARPPKGCWFGRGQGPPVHPP